MEETKICRRCKQEQPRSQYFVDKTKPDGLQYICKLCDLVRQERWREVNPEKAYQQRRKARYKAAFGITIEEYDKLFTEQQGLCAICNLPQPTKLLAVDHDHQTGKIRSLLCHFCNSGLDYFKDSPSLLASAIKYLDSHRN